MSLRKQISRRRMRRRGPLAFAIALLAACCVTAIGLIEGLGPYTICYRAIVSAIVLGAICSFGLSVIDIANTTR